MSGMVLADRNNVTRASLGSSNIEHASRATPMTALHIASSQCISTASDDWTKAGKSSRSPSSSIRTPIAWRPNLYLPDALVRRGRYDEAIELLLRIVEREPYEFTSHQMLADIYEAKGMNREEIEELGWMAASYGHPEIAPRLSQSFAASGYRGALRRWARELDQLAEAGQFDARDYLADYLPPARRSATRVQTPGRRVHSPQHSPARMRHRFRRDGRPEGHAKRPAVQLRPALSGPPATDTIPPMSTHAG